MSALVSYNGLPMLSSFVESLPPTPTLGPQPSTVLPPCLILDERIDKIWDDQNIDAFAKTVIETCEVHGLFLEDMAENPIDNGNGRINTIFYEVFHKLICRGMLLYQLDPMVMKRIWKEHIWPNLVDEDIDWKIIDTRKFTDIANLNSSLDVTVLALHTAFPNLTIIKMCSLWKLLSSKKDNAVIPRKIKKITYKPQRFVETNLPIPPAGVVPLSPPVQASLRPTSLISRPKKYTESEVEVAGDSSSSLSSSEDRFSASTLSSTPFTPAPRPQSSASTKPTRDLTRKKWDARCEEELVRLVFDHIMKNEKIDHLSISLKNFEAYSSFIPERTPAALCAKWKKLKYLIGDMPDAIYDSKGNRIESDESYSSEDSDENGSDAVPESISIDHSEKRKSITTADPLKEKEHKRRKADLDPPELLPADSAPLGPTAFLDLSSEINALFTQQVTDHLNDIMKFVPIPNRREDQPDVQAASSSSLKFKPGELTTTLNPWGN